MLYSFPILLRENYSGLNKELADVTVVIPPEVCVSARITRSAGNAEKLCCTLCDVLQNRVLFMALDNPVAGFQHAIAHFVNFEIVRQIRHGNLFWKIV